MIAVFADVIGHDGAAVFQMDGVSLGPGDGEQPYKKKMPHKKEDDDT